MARVSYVSREQIPAEVRDVFDRAASYGPFANQVSVLAHRPPIMHHVFKMLMELREESVLPRRYLELALVTVSKLNECTYCVSHHTPMLTVEGVSRTGIERLLEFENHPELDEVDKLVVEYATLVTQTPQRVRDDIFERLRERFTEPQLVELTWRTALCGAFNRFNDVLQLEIEPEAEQTLAKSA